MKILALDFSSAQRSVAVLNGSSASVCQVVETTPGHTMRPLAMIESALRQAGVEREQMECIAVGLGPGSYTGIRAAIALAQGWQLARGVKVLGVSSAACVATQAQAEGITGSGSVVIDAQRGEFYLAGYEFNAGTAREVSPLRLASLDAVRALERAGEMLIGPEVTRWIAGGRLVFPRAAALGQLALTRTDFVPGEKLEPIYLRETTFVKAPPSRIISSTQNP
jgi:tRNA threonylcarbamoyladenosine biosynthesis protein TsaB